MKKSPSKTAWQYGPVAAAVTAVILVVLCIWGLDNLFSHDYPTVSPEHALIHAPHPKRVLSGPLPTGVVFKVVDFTQASTGYVAGAGVIFETLDGGTDWGRVYHGSVDVSGLEMVSAQVGYAWGQAGNSTTVLKTIDGGAQWAVAGRVPARGIHVASWPTSQVGYVVTLKRDLLKTSNGGETWTILKQPAESVSFVTAAKGWVLERSTVYSTRNGGKSWTSSQLIIPSVPTHRVMIGGEIRSAPDGAVWVMLPGGAGMNQESYTLYRSVSGIHWTAVMARNTAGAGPAPSAAAVSGPGLSPGPMDPVSDHDAFASGMCWACGEAGTWQVVGTTDGGKHWSPPSRPYGALPGLLQSPYSISFPDRTTGYVLATSFSSRQHLTRLYKTTNAGRSWTLISR
ncbi:hypothetical protein B1757_04870 [Acidithiobacillus marinus]|uniref:Photosynthesis system II assembly factor Ycf48/Hcf136-like domain-containing protein n=1 Tax=Acidithiobacillus marinus TaxID=187490 RepID=A0A2I1DN65_9PROT|nr:hypothetical protein [Acidithiobacillus marinus]PKY11325.1 hypothetical protein B1757_04870 [Acidithiobacillus marinus]